MSFTRHFVQIEIKRQFIKDLEPLPKSIRAEIEEVIVSLSNELLKWAVEL
jgi:mRNA-degrading endonuclease RelE of RelBE toxin-antitoxin system